MAFRNKLIGGEIVSQENIRLIHTAHIREGEGAPSFYGYGMVVQGHPKLGTFYWHNGGNTVSSANWTDYADNGYLIVAASRAPNLSADHVVMKLTGALFDLDLRMQNSDEGEKMTSPPDAKMIANVKSLVNAFLTNIASNSKENWRTLIETRGAPEFVSLAPMDGHLLMFEKFHEKLGGFVKKRIEITGPDEISIVMEHLETGTLQLVVLGFNNINNGQLTGVAIED
ncbi:MAG: hypothetical protein COA69_05480 [Robiginitomaculum sp.]|nr:MAG: hypothetical protein COA69_05480 [Robiginitomaculum sp.]